MKNSKLLLILLLFFNLNNFSQTFKWAKNIGGSLDDGGYSVVADKLGNVYTSGIFTGTVDFDPGTGTSYLTSAGGGDVFISKLDSAGNFIWAKSVGGSSTDYGYSLALDSLENIYVTGIFSGTADFNPSSSTYNLSSVGSYDMYILKLDSSGNFVWAKKIGGTSYDYGYEIALDQQGNVYTTGYFQSTADFDPGSGTTNLTSSGNYDMFILKLDASGNFSWVKQIGGTEYENGFSITIDATGSIYTTGYFGGTVDFDPGIGTNNLTSLGNEDVFVLKLDASGNFVYAKSFGGISYDNAKSIVVDKWGNLYFTGSFYGTVDFDPSTTGTYNISPVGGYDIFILKLDSAANFKWAKSLGGTSDDIGESVALDTTGNVFTTGYFADEEIDFDPGTGSYNLTSKGKSDVFILKLDSAGNFIWANAMGDLYHDYGFSISIDTEDNLYATGSFYGTIDFDLGAGVYYLSSNTSDYKDLYILKMNVAPKDTGTGGGSGIIENYSLNKISVFPNPINENFTINLGSRKEKTSITITDIAGKIISKNIYKQSQILNTTLDAPCGIYFAKINTGNNQAVIKLVKQ